MDIFQAWLIFVLSGVGLTTLLYLLYRRLVRGKIICYIYNKNRVIYRKAIRPDEIGLLSVNGRAYYYQESQVMTTQGFLLREPTPALVFEEGKPNPINLFEQTVNPLGEDDISSNELSRILNDATVRDFVQAQSKVSLTELKYLIIGVGLVLLVTMIGVGYWLKGIDLGAVGGA